MKRWFHLRLNAQMTMRIIADAVMVNAALLVVLILRYVWLVGIKAAEISAQDAFQAHLQTYVDTAWILTSISLVVFWLNGFYTHSRFYQHGYKALIITQAVGLSYLLFSFVVFLFWDTLHLPRSILLPAWTLTLVFLIGSRALLEAWRSLAPPRERPVLKPAATPDDAGKVLLIGGAGYIGSALLPMLLEQGYRVRLLDLLLYGTQPIRNVLTHPNLEIVQADFRQVDQVVEATQDVDAVIHLGGIVGDPACAFDSDVTLEINLMATRMVAEVAKGSGVERLIFASTCSVYGASDDILDEHSSLNPVSLYASSKIASERVLLEMTSESFAPVVLRFATIYGLSGRTRFDLVVNLLTAKAVVDGEITVFDGEQWRPFLHVEDAARAVMQALEAPTALVRGHKFNVGSNEQNCTIRDVGELIKELVPAAVLTDTATGNDRRNYQVSFNKIKRSLGFGPKWTLEQGIRQVIEAIESGAVTDYRDVEYSNVGFLQTADGNTSELLRRQSDWAQVLLRETSAGYEPPMIRQSIANSGRS